MNLNITRETYRDEVAWLASHRGKIVKTGGISLSHAHRAPDPVTGKRVYRSGEFVGVLSADSGLWGRYQRAAGSYAQLVTDAAVANASIVWTARTAGIGGNLISLELDDPGANSQPLTVAVNAAAIKVNLSTGSTGTITATAAQVLQAIKDDPAANALVYGELARGHNGDGLVTAIAAANLAGGVAATGTQATLTTGKIGVVDDTSIIYTAKELGAAGNNIQIEYVVDGNDTPLSVELVGAGTAADPYVITVNLKTGVGGAAESTVAEIVSAVNSHYYTRNIITAEAEGEDTGVPLIDYGPQALTGGAEPNVSMAEGQFGILLHDVDVTNGNGIGAVLFGGKVLDARLPAASDEFVRAALPRVLFTTENAP